MRFCKDCSFYSDSREHSVDSKFRDGGKSSCTIVANGGAIFMCNHPYCFKVTRGFDLVHGKQNIVTRIAGQAQFNANFSCPMYSRRWWKFWIKK